MQDCEGPQAHRNPAILAGSIRAILVTACSRQVTNEDRLLTVEELQKNAQESLDFIAEECGSICGFEGWAVNVLIWALVEPERLTDRRARPGELRHPRAAMVSDAWEAWRNDRSQNAANEDR